MAENRIRQGGFTLIEILIVVAIIALIASLVAPNILGRFESSKDGIAKAQIEMLSSGIQAYIVDVGKCPASLNDLVAVSNEPKWRGTVSFQAGCAPGPLGQEIPGTNVPETTAFLTCILWPQPA